MSKPNARAGGRAPSAALIAQAAELKAHGSSWDAVAAAVGRAAETVRRWPTVDRAAWQAAHRAAEEQLLADAAAESVHTLRRQLRSDDEKTSREAAGSLMKFQTARRAKRRRPAQRQTTVSPAAVQLATYLMSLSDEQLQTLAGEVVPAADDTSGDVPSGTTPPRRRKRT